MNKTVRAIKGILDFYYEAVSVTRGRRYFDAMMIPTGVELWAGRRHLILEPFLCLRSRRAGRGPFWGAPSAA